MPLLSVARDNFDLTEYLIGQVLQTEGHQFAALDEYLPEGRSPKDWRRRSRASASRSSSPMSSVGRARVRHRARRRGRHSLVALLGASPGASTAAFIAISVLREVLRRGADGKRLAAQAEADHPVLWRVADRRCGFLSPNSCSDRRGPQGRQHSAAGRTRAGGREAGVNQRRMFDGPDGAPSVAAAVRFHHLVSHHFPVLHDRAGGMAHRARGAAPATGRPAYRLLFEFWLKIFGVAFGIGVVSGMVMAFQFGTNWSELSQMSGPIQGPLLSYETFTAFCWKRAFFGILLFGRSRVPPVVLPVFDGDGRLGHDAFGVLDHGQQQLDAGAGRLCRRERQFVPDDWTQIIFNRVVWVAVPAYAARVLLDRRVLRGGNRRVVSAAAEVSPPRRISCCAWALPCGGAAAGPALLRASRRRLCPRSPAGQVRRDRGAMA